ncbi:rhomboid-related protein 4 [Trichonephila clavata]|uniref:Rhomboid-related protein 4 n=1 Tax=Trichonephila clavata TaxID=2740835 RepID=A0A8X6M1A5_TRICU|nr:rhomboid-related protein 4 [Trichonephila clavata]
MQPGRRRQPGLGVMLLFYQIFGVIGYENIPPVTLATIGLQVAIFLRLFKLPWYKISHVCVSVYNVWTKKEYSRLIYAAFEHADDWHLYYNMLSFALKGRSLERKFGSIKFAYILAVFTVLTNAVLVFLNMLAIEHLDGYDQCAVGFSGVIFALKVLTTYYDSNFTHQVMGIPIIVPARYAVWVELLLIQLFVPNASFFGHLAGILVGMAYVKGPLKFVMDSIYSVVKAIIFPSASSPRFTPRAEPSGYASRREEFNEYVPPGMSEEEQLRQAMEESLREESRNRNVPPYPSASSPGSAPPPPGFIFGDTSNAPPPPGFSPDIDELRSRRAEHFSRFS